MSVAKRHHTVPQFYLRGFANGERIATVRLPGDQRFVQSVRKAASETNFYAVAGHEDGPDVFEKLLSSIEGDASRVFTRISSGTWPLELEDRWTLAHFIAVQTVRGPEQRRNMEHLAAQVARMEIGYGGRASVRDWVARNRGISISEEQAESIWDQATRPEGPPIKIGAIAHIEQMAELSEALLPYVAGRPWTLIRFGRRSLVTSDTPVGLVPHSDSPPWSGVGFGTAWGVTFPLTRKLGLLMSDPMLLAQNDVPVEEVHAGTFDHAEAGTARMEQFFNQTTIGSASLWVYHHPDDESFVPAELPEPNPVTMRMAGGPAEFTGEPIFGGPDTRDGPTPEE
ncbi:DUF4238 domain-containing protein [Nocardioides iriomotensis]|uniref:DUF4238 domain-containing protein n=1 Tax=Nocardioides iriomotensis TaxID=715784 RepID=A0A4Q5J7Y1_9ACTN|nr:DUF4238 domain-containing protein [Nocardioides iriomotensis]RYU14827.1 DUF4238 domain-containing protein [Nocardioides iriomotensis]